MNIKIIKTILLIVTCLFSYTKQQVSDPEFLKHYDEISDGCVTETGASKDEINKFWKERHFPTNDQKLKCYFKCVNIKLGVMDETGDVKDDVLKSASAHFEDAATNVEIVEECGRIQGADLCETAFKLTMCIRQAELD